jgi:uncharacterized membrane protein YccC
MISDRTHAQRLREYARVLYELMSEQPSHEEERRRALALAAAVLESLASEEDTSTFNN